MTFSVLWCGMAGMQFCKARLQCWYWGKDEWYPLAKWMVGLWSEALVVKFAGLIVHEKCDKSSAGTSQLRWYESSAFLQAWMIVLWWSWMHVNTCIYMSMLECMSGFPEAHKQASTPFTGRAAASSQDLHTAVIPGAVRPYSAQP